VLVNDSVGVLFSPVSVKSASAQVADQIVAAIRSGSVLPGAKLPSERELATSLQVSRATLREALAALELAGLIQSRQGHGTVVVATPGQIINWGVEVSPTEVFEARLVLEPQLARLAAEKRFPEDLEALRAAVAAVEDEYARTGAYQSDLDVHRAVARAARNPVLELALEDALRHTASPRWVQLRTAALAPQQTRETHVEEVRQVAGHIEQGNGEAAAEVWHRHLAGYRDEMLEGLHQD
jgi:GntR family transcriptional repressor for pyruvate dehydrogenase complex